MDTSQAQAQEQAQEQAQRRRLVELGEEECWALVRTRAVGRVAWQGGQGITVLPLNFAVEGTDVLLRTTPYSLLARDGMDGEVAFQVDDVDAEQHTGWSVLMHGVCRREQRPGAEPTPWVTGPRVLGLRIAVRSISGRRLAG
ncbi:pyridoxamine 5'-phosphate oxidase family protein [Nocardioides sp. SYSU DS0651]|uniref:pyridoxamine 5'-phosphate oxidase family protein n=1 Tax=Nocardioides sp. SYSU DS0651 TaxID=3415955 RepID=UPI003F4CA437